MKLADQIGYTLEIPNEPLRIISIVPSQTELLYELGLEKQVVGITRFCVHPPHWLKEKKKVGGTKNVNFKRLDSLSPNLIIANKEENDKDTVLALQKKYPVYTSNIQTIEDAIQMIYDIGRLTNTAMRAEKINANIRNNLKHVSENKTPQVDTLYFIWKDPYMVAGSDTFIHQMMRYACCKNIITQERYPTLTEAEIISLNPQRILLSSEPYPFGQKEIDEFRILLPDAEIKLVDGEMFSWYGSRIQYALPYLNQLFD